MITDYIDRKLEQARYKLLGDRKTYFGEIPGLQGVWASGASLEGCRRQLREVLEDWLVLKLRDREAIPGFRVRMRLPAREATVARR